jgi:GTP-binding protein
MKIRTIEVSNTAYTTQQIVRDSLPKIVFIGRSNVGKSSLINTLLGRKKLARTSNKPGKTVSVNYYKLNGTCYFVDLPGYGYARISHDEKDRTSQLITAFFEASVGIRAIALLIDSRFGFMETDLDVLQQIMAFASSMPELDATSGKSRPHANKSTDVLTILTKSDKLSFSKSKQQQQLIQNQFQFAVIPFSIKSRSGVEELWSYLDKHL